MAKETQSIAITAIKLFVICFAATLVLALLNLLTRDIIAQNSEKAFAQSCREVMNDASTFEKIDLSAYAEEGEEPVGALAKNDAGEVVGLCIRQSVKGYNSGLVFMTGISADAKTVTGISILEHEETPGLGADADKDAFKEKFRNLEAPIEDDDMVMVKTGATKTSIGIHKGVNRAAAIANAYFEKEGKQ